MKMTNRDSEMFDDGCSGRQSLRLLLYTFDCTGCGRCVESCPSGVLQLVDNGRCRFVQAVDERRCIECGRCVRVCRNGAVKLYKKEYMKSYGRKIGFGLMGLGLLAVGVALVMVLWNALVPAIIGWQPIGYWQAWGVMLLVRLLFGHFGMPFAPHGGRRHLHEMMRGMSQEEKREWIRRRMRGICRREGFAADGADA